MQSGSKLTWRRHKRGLASGGRRKSSGSSSSSSRAQDMSVLPAAAGKAAVAAGAAAAADRAAAVDKLVAADKPVVVVKPVVVDKLDRRVEVDRAAADGTDNPAAVKSLHVNARQSVVVVSSGEKSRRKAPGGQDSKDVDITDKGVKLNKTLQTSDAF